MSSPARFLNTLPSSPSSSSSHQSTSSSISHPVPSKRKKIDHFAQKKHDKYLISAEQWTPIIGPSLPKRQKESSRQLHENYHFDSSHRATDELTDPKLVRLFDPDSTPSSSSASQFSPQVDNSILVTAEQKVSLYVTCFEEMLNTVLEHENYLFSPSEITLLSGWQGLSYPSKYLFVRLFMRKHDNWFRLDKLLNYCVDIGEIQPACEGLCVSIDSLIRAIPPKPKPSEPQQKQSILSLEPPQVEDKIVISELAQYLTDTPQPLLKNSPRHSEVPIPSVDNTQLDNWCLLAAQLSHFLDQALNALGIQDWSTPAPPYDPDDSHVIPSLPPVPPAVTMRSQPIITEPGQRSTLYSPHPPAFADIDPRLQLPSHASALIEPVRKSSTPHRKSSSPPAFNEIDPDLTSFASMTSNHIGLLNTDELFSCMNMDELKGLAKKLNSNPHTTRDMIILGIKSATRNQSTLFGAPPPRGKQKKQLSLKFTQKGLKESQILSLNSKILKIVGPCIQLTPKVCSLFKRVHLIYYRSTTISEKTMTASILARMNLRSYPKCEVIRTNAIFESRQCLLDYENALELEKQFDDLLLDERKAWGEDQQAKARRQEAKNLRLKKALDLFENAWLLWQQTVIEEDARMERLQSTPHASESDLDRSTYYKRRFHPGWPLTRIMQKGSGILARFKEYEREVHILEALLQQRHFRRGKRGQWYDRLALVLMTKLSSTSVDPTQVRNSALYTCEQGLSDPDTHQIYRFSLSRRLIKIQSTLSQHQQQSLSASKHENKSQIDRNHKQDDLNASITDLSSIEDWKSSPKITIHRLKLSDDHQTGRKTIWKSMLDNSSLTVEEVSLEYYVSLGWRGFHSEGGILKMIFTLVFWNIIFAPIPGAFETPYQTAPLDIATDAFAIVRRPLIEEQIRRIEMLGNEEVKAKLEESYTREFPRKTMCLGISQYNWDRYTLQDLLEIVDCMKPQSFNLISRVFFEDWNIWSAGVPDLCLWKFSENRCKFVEVKGPGDKLSEQQKNWFSLLSKAEGIEIEICSVKEDE